MRYSWIAGAGLLWTAMGLSPVQAVAPGHSAVVRCESLRGRDHYCPVDTMGGVVLRRHLSSSQCAEGETWGADAGGIWVRSGCRGEFEVPRAYSGRRDGQVGGGYAHSRPGAGAQGSRVVCASRGGRAMSCPVRVPSDVELVRQLSSAECRFDWSWGFDRERVWVDRGCRAEFLVY